MIQYVGKVQTYNLDCQLSFVLARWVVYGDAVFARVFPHCTLDHKAAQCLPVIHPHTSLGLCNHL